MGSDDKWTVNSNEAVTVSLVAPAKTSQGFMTLSEFHPQFTYPIFGTEESIFGYENLKINLRFNASDMRPNLDISYSKEYTPVGDTKATPIRESLEEFLPPVALLKTPDFVSAMQGVPADWTPPGELVAQYSKNDATYEIWKGSLADLAIRQQVSRIQVLLTLFIEGARHIDLEDPDCSRWTVFFLYQKKQIPGSTDESAYTFVGYSTIYRFFFYQQPAKVPEGIEDLDLDQGKFDLAGLPSRSRISQFLILPPFQGKGHGPKFYAVIYAHYLKHKPTLEITVEDPNEAFDDLRDLADLRYMREVPEFRALRINTDAVFTKGGILPTNLVIPGSLEDLRKKVKMAPRQFARVVELQLMTTLPETVRPSVKIGTEKPRGTKEEKYKYFVWTALVKKRIYIQNRAALGQLDLQERVEALEKARISVELDYARLLSLFETPRLDADSGSKRSPKRPAEDDGEGSGPSKKARVEDA